MLRLLFACMMAVAMLAAAVSTSVADHMNGTYAGTGGATGITLVLRQSGETVTGQFSGTQNGTLSGQSDGADTVNGYLETGGIRYQFFGLWTPGGFEIGLFDNQGNTESYRFVAAGMPPDNTPPADQAQYWLAEGGEQIGPLTLQQVLDRIGSGESNRDTDVWTAELNQWVDIETIPELAAALQQPVDGPPPVPAPAGNYYLHADGVQTGPLTHEEVLAGIADGTISRRVMVWQPGQPEWMPIDSFPAFASAFPPEAPRPVQYFVIEDGQRVGPLNEDEMLARIAAATTTGDDLAWKRGLEAWAPVSSLPEFADALAALEAPPLPPDLPDEEVPPPLNEDEPPPLPGEDLTEDEGPPPIEVPAPELPEETPPPLHEPPPMTDDEPPLEEETGDGSGQEEEDPLVPLLRAYVEDEMGSATAEAQEEALACLLKAMEPLSAEHRQMLVDTGLEPSSQQEDELSAAYPGIEAQIEACSGESGPDLARSEVGLPDGRSFAVVGGNNHSVTSVEGGTEFMVDGITIAFVGGTLTVDGEAREVPEFTTILEAHIAEGAVTLVADP